MARKLKYHAPNTDLRALERELGSGREDAGDIEQPPEEEPDPYAAYADRYDGDEEDLREDDWLPPKKQLADAAPRPAHQRDRLRAARADSADRYPRPLDPDPAVRRPHR